MLEEDKPRLIQLIARLEKTTDDEWITDKVRSGNQNCVFGHVFAMGGDNERLSNEWWNWFDWHVCSTFVIYPVNDGTDERYPQATPKARILALLADILSGAVKCTWESMEEEAAEQDRLDAIAAGEAVADVAKNGTIPWDQIKLKEEPNVTA